MFRQWLSFISSELNTAMGPLFRDIPEQAKEKIREQLFKRLDYLDVLLHQQPHLLAELSMADIYLFTVLLWGPRVGINLTDWPSLIAFQERLGARDSARVAMAAESP